MKIPLLVVSFFSAGSVVVAQILARDGTPEMQELYRTSCTGGRADLYMNKCICSFLDSMERASYEFRSVTGQEVPCIDGVVSTTEADYPCKDIKLMSFVGLAELNSVFGSATDEGNDIWGWTAPTGEEFAIMGLTTGTAFVEITDPVNPKYLGKLPTSPTGNTMSFWRDVKVYKNHAFIVADRMGNHGMQVFDLTQLVNFDLSNGPQVFTETAMDSTIGSVHNIFINEDNGVAYVVGGPRDGLCRAGLQMFDLTTPTMPTFIGCFADDGYVHDVQCVFYEGNDSRYIGREICFACNEDTVTIIDVTDKNNPIQLSRTGYPTVHYTHQGWLTEDHNTFLFGDEGDEQNEGIPTTTYIVDVRDLEQPVITNHMSPELAIDHNMYVKGDKVYQANYDAGLRVLKVNNSPGSIGLSEYAHFDVRPESNRADYNGAWSNYPYFASGSIIVSSIDRGLFVLREEQGVGCKSLLGEGVEMQKCSLGCQTKCVPTNLVSLFELLGFTRL